MTKTPYITTSCDAEFRANAEEGRKYREEQMTNFLRKPANEFTGEERRKILADLTKVWAGNMKCMPGTTRLSAQQLAYAKGRAWKLMRQWGF